MTYLASAAFGCAVLVHLYACIPPEKQPLRSITKCLLMPLLLALYLSVKNPVSWILIGALFFSFWGDLFLSLDHRTSTFLSGLSAFGASHILYCIHFFRLLSGTFKPGVLIPALLVYTGLLFLFLSRIFRRLPKVFVLPCLVYMILIVLMNLITLNSAVVLNTRRQWVDYIGALLFLASDAVLCVNMFYRHRAWHSVFIMATYILAQALIVL